MRTDLCRQPKGASAAAIRNQIEKILTSESFVGSHKLSQLLAFLVDQAIEGHDLNEYSIAVDVFQKDDSFDPRIDPLVRVHASRLRNKLTSTGRLSDCTIQSKSSCRPGRTCPGFEYERARCGPKRRKRRTSPEISWSAHSGVSVRKSPMNIFAKAWLRKSSMP